MISFSKHTSSDVEEKHVSDAFGKLDVLFFCPKLFRSHHEVKCEY